MAETKQAKAKPKAKSKAKPAKAQSSKSSTNGSKAKAKAGKAARSDSTKNGAQSKNGAQHSANGSGPMAIVQKAKIPLLAGGAAVAGVAGAVVAASHAGGKRKVLGVPVPKRSKLSMPKKNDLKSDAHKVAGAVADAAKRADTFGQGVSRIASSVRQVSESADEAVKKG